MFASVMWDQVSDSFCDVFGLEEEGDLSKYKAQNGYSHTNTLWLCMFLILPFFLNLRFCILSSLFFFFFLLIANITRSIFLSV